MTWIIVQECKDCSGQGKLYKYNTTPNKCHECEGTGEREWYEETYHYETKEGVKKDYSNTSSITLT
jgi:DnaJ-class molecular chaperone|tara:strand:- start:228 stop:425 length:198 start_codon:yes stop_codon:yes gene_type:complete